MSQEDSSRGLTSVGRNDFTHRFADRYKEWLRTTGEETKQEEDRVETYSELPAYEIYGFENEIKSLQHFLLDQKVYKEFKSLVIVGEHGVGKTALCQKIFNDDDVKSVYAPRIWVSMPSNESKEGLDGKICVLKKILKALGVEDSMFESIPKEKELSALLYALHLNLRWKKYMIVFDDVREEDNWNEMLQDDEEKQWGKYLSDGFTKGSGGRVIYTTRDENLAKKLVAEKHEIHRLWPLSDSYSVWKIYEAMILEREKEPPRNDKKCIDELMNKSRGLPLAARLLAELDPVLLENEKADQNGSNEGQTDSVNNLTSEENKTTQPL
ncbi:P-loop containing nucleoside triphosphate hydrolase [Arabidopsis suecica]|uniref:P-loop containing nucleoside triphosphate hydrolase n=1 Tax=Arabidopsis suecica TaxID=45249 RepID=A0A8T1XYT4_ARASU|nr:P-loop containing nucleoside triphosphate hydrolase [Arabidopsis suecica]